MSNISLNAGDGEYYVIDQKSKLEISGTSLLSKEDDKVRESEEVYQRTIHVLEAHIGELEMHLQGEKG